MMAEVYEVFNGKVRDLILAYEKISSSNGFYTRPRAKSIGAVNRRSTMAVFTEFKTYEDIETELRQMDGSLNYYLVYNKEKHVAFQERLFNVLTCLVNMKADSHDDREKRGQLIDKIKTLVIVLNQKLPSPAPVSVKRAKYVPYVHNQRTKELDINSSNKSYNSKDNEKVIPLSSPDDLSSKHLSDAEEYAPVRRLRANFEEVPKMNVDTDVDGRCAEDRTLMEAEKTGRASLNKDYNVSVCELANLFEKKPDDRKLRKMPRYQTSLNETMPFTGHNLTMYRLRRAKSGSYINNSGFMRMTSLPMGFKETVVNENSINDEKGQAEEAAVEYLHSTVAPTNIEESKIILNNSVETSPERIEVEDVFPNETNAIPSEIQDMVIVDEVSEADDVFISEMDESVANEADGADVTITSELDESFTREMDQNNGITITGSLSEEDMVSSSNIFEVLTPEEEIYAEKEFDKLLGVS